MTNIRCGQNRHTSHRAIGAAGLLLLLSSLSPNAVHAGALYFPEMSSASEAGYAGAGMVARANDAGTAFSNPAGMTRFDEPQMLVGGTGVYIVAGARRNEGNTAEGTSSGANKRIVPAGSFAYVRPISDKVAVGVSAHNYFGLAIDWKDDWVGRYSSVSIALLAPQLQPSIAYKVNDWLSVGAGAAITMGYMKEKLRVAPVQPDGRDGKLRISDNAWAVQGNLAMMIEPSDRTRIGIRWLSETDLDFKDSPDLSGPDLPDLPGLGLDGIDLGITMPQTLNVGVHHQWNDKLALLGSVGWEEFSQFGRIQVGVDDTGVGTTIEEDFRDVWSVGIGAEYKLRPDWELTAGFNFDSSMSSDRTRPIVIPLGKMYRYGVGVKHKRPSGRTINGGLSWIWEGNMGIPENNGVDVTYTDVSIWVASLSYSF